MSFLLFAARPGTDGEKSGPWFRSELLLLFSDSPPSPQLEVKFLAPLKMFFQRFPPDLQKIILYNICKYKCIPKFNLTS